MTTRSQFSAGRVLLIELPQGWVLVGSSFHCAHAISCMWRWLGQIQQMPGSDFG